MVKSVVIRGIALRMVRRSEHLETHKTCNTKVRYHRTIVHCVLVSLCLCICDCSERL